MDLGFRGRFLSREPLYLRLWFSQLTGLITARDGCFEVGCYHILELRRPSLDGLIWIGGAATKALTEAGAFFGGVMDAEWASRHGDRRPWLRTGQL